MRDDARRAIARGAAQLDAMPMAKPRRKKPNGARTEIGAPTIDWADPEPLRESISARSYPLGALPSIMRDAVAEVGELTQAPTSLVAASALGVVSIACQGLVDVRRDPRLIGPASIYNLLIAESGERKTTCDKYFGRALRDWCEAKREQLAPLLKEYQAKRDAWEARRAGLRDAIKTKSRKRESCDAYEHALANLEEPERPRMPHVIYVDATAEALAWGLANDWPSGGLLTSEAGSVFGGHAMQRDSMMRSLALHNTLWDGGTHTVTRRTSESFSVSGARLTLSLMTQLPTLRAFIERGGGLVRGTGFLARFLIAWPESTIGTRIYRPPPENRTGLAGYHARVTKLLDASLEKIDSGALRPATLTLSHDAFVVWRELHDNIERDMADGGPFASVHDAGAKCAENAARLAALFHAMVHGTEGEIGAEHMRGAATLALWHLVEAARLLADLDASPELTAAERLDAWLIAECRRRGVTVIPTREVLRAGPAGTRTRGAMQVALAQLSEAGRIRCKSEGKRRLIFVHPGLVTPELSQESQLSQSSMTTKTGGDPGAPFGGVV